MAHIELDSRKRRAIEYMLNAKKPVRKIAAEIGRHVSTTYRDIKRNGYTDTELPELNGYYGVVAQRSAAQRRARRLKLVPFVDLRKAVIKQLKEGWSPEQIAGPLPCEGQTVRVSHETISLTSTAQMRNQRNLRVTCPIAGKNGSHTVHVGPVA